MIETVIVTGASKGIGADTAILFAEKGYNVIINYNRSREAACLLERSLSERGLSVKAIRADITNSAEVANMFEYAEQKFGGVDILINNAGIAQQKLFQDISLDEWNKMITTNLTGAFICSKFAFQDMIRSHKGAIVNVASIWGETGGSCEVHYSAAKAGIIGFTKALAKELGPSGIRVNCVAPGVIKTAMTENIPLDAMGELVDSTPLSRLGVTNDIAKAIFFLATEQSSFITGEVLSVNGGLYI